MEAEGIKAKFVNSIHKTFYYKWKKFSKKAGVEGAWRVGMLWWIYCSSN